MPSGPRRVELASAPMSVPHMTTCRLAIVLMLSVGLLPTTALAQSSEATVVAVFPVQGSSFSMSKGLRTAVTNYVAARIAATPGYSVVPQAELNSALRQQKITTYEQCYDESCQIQIGKEVAASQIVSTQIIKIASVCTVSITFFDLRRNASVFAKTAEGSCKEDGLLSSIRKALTGLGAAASQTSAPVAAVEEEEEVDAPAPEDPVKEDEGWKGGSARSGIGVPPPDFTFDLAFGLGLTGDLELEDDIGTVITSDRDPAFGLEARALWSIFDYLAVGPLVRFSRTQVSDATDAGIFQLSVDVAPTGRFRITEIVEVYATLPVGLEVAIFEDSAIDTGFGYNVGILFGFRGYVSEGFSLYTELGAVWRSVNTSGAVDDGFGTVDIDFTARQNAVFTLNFGIGFGG